MEEQAIINMPTFSQLRDLMGADFMNELIDTYRIETRGLIDQLGEAFKNRDAASFGHIAHSIKSSSASLGALAFSQQARELELMGKANELTDVEEKVTRFVAAFDKVQECLEGLRNES